MREKIEEKKDKPWYRYTFIYDKSISHTDKILAAIYIIGAFLIPISAVISLLSINYIRKDKVHETYKKSLNFTVILIAFLSFLANLTSILGK